MIAAHAAATSKPDSIVAGVNREICSREAFLPLASLFLVTMNTATGVFNYCSAGHPPALLLRANGMLEKLSEGGMLLGVVSNSTVCQWLL